MKNTQLSQKNMTIAVIGMGYVGLPLAVEFAKKTPVIGFDISEKRIQTLNQGIDPTGFLEAEDLQKADIRFTTDPVDLSEAQVFIVAVPTPVHKNKMPDLGPLETASQTVGAQMPAGSLVVYESTVYPGATERVCIPILERMSGMKAGVDFHVGYSPERINPGDTEHLLTSVTKIVSGQDPEALEAVAQVYSLIFDDHVAGNLFKARSIKVAEAAKVVENTQRDINIAFMNEISQIMHKLDIDTMDVLNAMNTKWNALGFRPGLVGGHCISVDPYYLIQEAERANYHADLLTISREINEEIPVTIAHEVVRQMVLAGKAPSSQAVYVAGLTFKGNVNDLRNSKAKRIVETLQSYGIEVKIADPMAGAGEVEAMFHLQPVAMDDIQGADCLIVAAAHGVFTDWTAADFAKMMAPDGTKLVVDICNLFSRDDIEAMGYQYWNL